MKLLRTQTRVNSEDSLGLGIEAAVVLALFFLAGFGLDRLFGTQPVFMIVLTLVGAVGLFAKYKYRYDERMNELEAERAARAASRGPAVAATGVLRATDDQDGRR
jgi:ATP synthase protein I